MTETIKTRSLAARIGCRRGWMLQGLAIATSIALAGCGAPERKSLDPAQFKTDAAADSEAMAGAMNEAITKMLDRIESRVSKAPGAELPTINILAMSGGGDYGAFGAGLLVGWGMSENPNWKRPDFDAVTGVSTGAMLAPFAYLGTEEACLAVEKFYRNPKKDWIVDRGLFFFLPFNPSFMTIPGLSRDLRHEIDAKFIAKMAERAREKRVIIISATNLDLGRQKFWELGEEATAAVANGDYARVQDILLASAAIPAVFPPVEIGQWIYGDGGVTANVFLRLDARSPHSFIARWLADHPGQPLPKVRYWVIINNQMEHIPKTVQLSWPDVVGPSLSTAIRSATICEVKLLAAEADFVNAVYESDIEVRVIAIPDEWRPPVPGDFKPETMRSLTDLGRKLGAEPNSWSVWASPATSKRKWQ